MIASKIARQKKSKKCREMFSRFLSSTNEGHKRKFEKQFIALSTRP
jgi:hypothetical protein